MGSVYSNLDAIESAPVEYCKKTEILWSATGRHSHQLPQLPPYLPSLLVGSFDPLKPVPNMAYNVFGRMLNLVQRQLSNMNRYHFLICRSLSSLLTDVSRDV